MNNGLSAEEIFHAAREKFDAAERAGFLEGACGNDVSLRAKVEALLKADAEAGMFLGAVTQHNDPDATIPRSEREIGSEAHAAPSEHVGEMISRYKLLQQIGEGGFGMVYMAEQREPVKRRVALKVIKLGMDTRQVIARFEAERQALAMMDHPNIAKVLDAGSTDTGRLYFVMEYIKGVPILEYCDTDRLDTRSRLELFTQVCHAIQHAHQKGIIHRDIKPNNVLVTMHDGIPVPKVIDFGIAKATSAELTTKTLFTEHRQMIGTPAYMSPEQAEMSGLDIDTRSDIYSLGVLLYELLTGTTPFAHEELMSKGFAEMMRIIREVEPQRPSTRLSALGDTGTRTAQLRRAIDPKTLSRTLKGDLDWIVMKCIEKDRTRRYETANGLAADIKRHLDDEPVTAGAPSRHYRLKKFVRRNKGSVIAGGIVAAVLVLGLIGTSAGLIWAIREKGNALIISEFMGTMFSAATPWVAKGRDTALLKEMMDEGAARIERGELKYFPAAELHMRATIGYTYIELAQYDAAQGMLEPAVALARSIYPGDHHETAKALIDLALLRQTRGDLAGAEPLAREALEMTRRRGEFWDPSGLAGALDRMGEVLKERGDLEEAESLLREALEIKKRIKKRWNRSGSDFLAPNLINLGFALQNRGDLAGAEPLFREALEMSRRDNPGDHVPVAFALYGQGRQLQARGDPAEAESLYRESLEMLQRLYPGDHKHVAMGLAGLASLLQERGDLESAEPLFRESLEMRERVLGKEHRDTLFSVILMGGLRVAQGNYAEAMTLLGPIEGKAREVFTGGNAYKLASLLMNLGNGRAGLAKTNTDFAAAEANLLEAHDNFVKAPGPFPKDTRDSVQALVDLYVTWNKAEPGKGYHAKAAEWKAKFDTAAP